MEQSHKIAQWQYFKLTHGQVKNSTQIQLLYLMCFYSVLKFFSFFFFSFLSLLYFFFSLSSSFPFAFSFLVKARCRFEICVCKDWFCQSSRISGELSTELSAISNYRDDGHEKTRGDVRRGRGGGGGAKGRQSEMERESSPARARIYVRAMCFPVCITALLQIKQEMCREKLRYQGDAYQRRSLKSRLSFARLRRPRFTLNRLAYARDTSDW